jgi:hypothetical protein
VDLKVVASGAVENYPAVAADQLYKITEGSGMHRSRWVSRPPIRAARRTQWRHRFRMFIWRDCPSGQWRLKTAAARGSVTYSGKVTSSTTYTSVTPVGLSGSDVVDYSINPKQIAFTFNTTGGSTGGQLHSAGWEQQLPQGGCPSITQVYFRAVPGSRDPALRPGHTGAPA